MNKIPIQKLIGIGVLLFAIGFNLWIYRLEPTAKVDPNDNPFQYALVDRTNQMWDFAASECASNNFLPGGLATYPLCHFSFLMDHWVPNWAQGYNLPYYYSHMPQIAIVTTYRFFSLFPFLFSLSLFEWYHVVIYLLLCLFPATVFWALRVIRLNWIAAGFGALAAALLSTDGLYGLDASSFLWRGYGLSAQLFAMFPMPLAIAYGYRYVTDQKEHWFQVLPTNLLYIFRKRLKLSKVALKENGTLPPSPLPFAPALFFLLATIAGHLGLGVIALMSLGFLAISPTILLFLHKTALSDIFKDAKERLFRLSILAGLAVILLAYFILPAFLHDDFHNISFWDPVWKFNSWGWKEIMTLFFNGALFDFGRFPLITLLLIIGAFGMFLKNSLHSSTREHNLTKTPTSNLQFPTTNFQPPISSLNHLTSFSFLFLFWLLLFFGRATWGGLIDLIPGMKDFHQSRFIVGLHLAGFFLAPIGFSLLIDQLTAIFARIVKEARIFLSSLDTSEDVSAEEISIHPLALQAIPILIGVGATILFYNAASPHIIAYAKHNDVLIKQGNENFDKQNPDVEKLFTELASRTPGRVFTGRGGSWGKELVIAETTYFMHLSTYGVPVILWLPETWSPNSDIEQFFVDDWPEHYDLLNVRYIVTTPSTEPQPFWMKVTETPSWKLFEATTSGYFTTGSLASVVSADKEHYVNVVRLWLQSDYVKNKIFPQFTFKKSEMVNAPIPAFHMVDEATYQIRDGKTYGLFGDVPTYEAPPANVKLMGPEEIRQDMVFKTTVDVGDDCQRCLVILKQSAHPSWKAWVNGKRVKPITVFPFYIGVPVTDAGRATIEVRYEPSFFKVGLFVLGLILLVFLYLPNILIQKIFLKFSKGTP